ncbi:uncharacterized protein LOC143413906 [Maylandia zebra]|uniref:uncharacterized protein LOC143413906 n=1 Tax=Maylandia zebra TaxID=106582 RepID=UPI00403C2BFC
MASQILRYLISNRFDCGLPVTELFIIPGVMRVLLGATPSSENERHPELLIIKFREFVITGLLSNDGLLYFFYNDAPRTEPLHVVLLEMMNYSLSYPEYIRHLENQSCPELLTIQSRAFTITGLLSNDGLLYFFYNDASRTAPLHVVLLEMMNYSLSYPEYIRHLENQSCPELLTIQSRAFTITGLLSNDGLLISQIKFREFVITGLLSNDGLLIQSGAFAITGLLPNDGLLIKFREFVITGLSSNDGLLAIPDIQEYLQRLLIFDFLPE